MPSARNPDVRGHLYVTFAVDFPPDNTLSDDALSALERVLPPRPERSLLTAAATASEQPSEPSVSVEEDVEKTMRNLLGDAYEPGAEKPDDAEGGEGAAPQKAPAPEPAPEPEIELITAQLEELPSAARDARAKAQARRQRFNPFAAMFGGGFTGEFNDSDEEGSSPSRERKRGAAESEDGEHPEGGARHEGAGDAGGQQHHEGEGHGEGGEDDDDEVEETMRNLLGDAYEPGVEEPDEAGEHDGQRGPQVQCATS